MTKCKWEQDEVCVNADCPVCADFCPVTHYPEICKFAEKEQENRYKKGLKPYPFCGEAPKIVVYKGKDGFRDRFAAQCAYDEGGCGAEGGQRHSRDEAISIWNERKFILRGRAQDAETV